MSLRFVQIWEKIASFQMKDGKFLGPSNLHIILLKDSPKISLANIDNMSLLHTTLVLKANPGDQMVKVDVYNPYKGYETQLDLYIAGKGR